MINKTFLSFFAVAKFLLLSSSAEEEPKKAVPDLEVSTYISSENSVQLKTPTHIAFGPNGQEIVTDLKNHRFLFRDQSQKELQSSTLPLQGPHSVVYNPKDQLYYANDTENHRIIAFAHLDKNDIAFETKTIAGIPLKRPHDVVYDPATDWVYAINPNSGHVFRFKGIGKQESAIKVPVQGYARSLSLIQGKLYVIGSSKGRLVEIVDWESQEFKVYDSYDPSNRQGPAGSWTRTGLVLNDVDFFKGYWYAASYFTKSYAKGSDANEFKFIRFATLDDFTKGQWEDLSHQVPPDLTPYYLSIQGDAMYLAVFHHEKPGQGDAILKFTQRKSKN